MKKCEKCVRLIKRIDMYIHIRNNYKAEILQEYDSVVECMRGSRKFYWGGGWGFRAYVWQFYSVNLKKLKIAGGDWSPLSSSVHGVTYQLLHRYVDSLWKEKRLGEKFYILMYIFVWDLIYAGFLLLKIFKFYTQFFEHCISLFLRKPVLIIFYAYWVFAFSKTK